MRAILFPKYGRENHLSLVERPTPKPNSKEVLIKVINSSNNAMDWHLMRGVWMVRGKLGLFKPKKQYDVLGADISGEVVSVGNAVKTFKEGDRVFGDIFTGGYAEYALATEDQIALVPEGVTHEQAAAIPVAGMTALKSIRDIGKVKKGDQVLINGASGGVGTFAVQMAKHYGGIVTAVCSKRNTDAVKSLGADKVINYETTDFCTGETKYDQIIDVVGNRKPRHVLKALKPAGICAVVGLTKFRTLFSFMLHPSKRIKVVHVEVSPSVLNDLGEMLANGHVKSYITARFPLTEVPAAISKIGTRRTCGKQVVENQK